MDQKRSIKQSIIVLFFAVVSLMIPLGAVADIPSHCSNSIQDSDETGLDCGGSCNACQTCGTNGPQLVAAGITAGLNDLGEIVWSAFEPSTGYLQIHSNTRGTLTSDNTLHTASSVNNHGEVVWSQRDPNGQGSEQIYSSTRGQLTFDAAEHYQPAINDLGEVVWSQYVQNQYQVFSSVLGQLTFDQASHSAPSINNHGDVVWVTNGQYLNGLINGMYSLVTTPSGSLYSVSINDSGEIAYSLGVNEQPLRIYSTIRGLLTGACEDAAPQFLTSMNNCGDIAYMAWTDSGPSVYTLQTGTACAVTGDHDGDGVLNNVDNCPFVSNPNQLDTNGNGIGDACELVSHCTNSIQDADETGIDCGGSSCQSCRTCGATGPQLVGTGFAGGLNNIGEIVWSAYDPATNHQQIYSNTRGKLTNDDVNNHWSPSVNNHGEVVWVQNAPWPGALGQGPAQVYSSTRGQLTADNTHHEHPVVNDLGEVVWSQQEWNNSSHYTQGNSQIYSSVLGQLTFEASMHNSPSLNNHGDVVWVTSNQYINGLINGMYTTVTTSAGMIESVSINDSGEIAYSLDDPGSSSFRIYSTVRGLLTGACEVETPQFQVSLNACGNITYGVWTDFGPSLYTLATNTACTLTGDYDHDGILNNVDTCPTAVGSCDPVAHCSNSIQDADETGIDCGGSSCQSCRTCGATGPQLVGTGFAGGLNGIGEIVWSAYDPATNHQQIYSNTRGKLTNDDVNNHWSPSVNNHGEVVWVQNAPWPGALGQGPAQVYSSTRGQLTADNTHHEHPVINDLGEVVWSQQEWNNSSHYTQGNSQIYSSVLGQLTFEASMHNSPSLNNHGDVVWVTSNQYINGLINGMYTTVTTSAGMIESVSINDSGEIAYSLDDPGSSSFRIYSTVRGLLTGACEVETPQFQVSLNACGNITYGVWTDFGPSLYTLATNTACTLTGDYDHDGILNNVDTCPTAVGSCDPVAHCSNSIQDADETGVDCGGSSCQSCRTCGATGPQLVGTGFAGGLNNIGEIVWSAYDPATNHQQIYSNTRGKLTNDDVNNHWSPSVNNHGEVVWVQNAPWPNGLGQGPAQVYSSTRGQLTADNTHHEHPVINDLGEVVWSQQEWNNFSHYAQGNSQIYSSVLGQLTFEASMHNSPSLNNHGDVVWVTSNQYINGLINGMYTTVTTSAGMIESVSINDSGEIAYSLDDPGSSSFRIYSTVRGLLTGACEVETPQFQVSLNACGNITYGVWTDFGPSLYTLATNTACTLTGDYDHDSILNNVDTCPTAVGSCDPVAHCSNSIQDADETGVDCGGSSCQSCRTCGATGPQLVGTGFAGGLNNIGEIVWSAYDPATNHQQIYSNTRGKLTNDDVNNHWSPSVNNHGEVVWVQNAPWPGALGQGPAQVYSSTRGQLTADNTHHEHPVINDLGEVVWSQQEWNNSSHYTQGNSQIYSSVLGQLTFEASMHNLPSLNNHGDVVWVTSNQYINGLINGMYTTVTTSAGMIESVSINDSGEIAYSLDDPGSSSFRIYSTVRGLLTGACEVETPQFQVSLNACGNITYGVWTDFGPSLYTLATNTACTLTGDYDHDGILNNVDTCPTAVGSCDPVAHCSNSIQDADETGIDCGGSSCQSCRTCGATGPQLVGTGFAGGLNGIGEIVWSAYDPATNHQQIYSNTRGKLTNDDVNNHWSPSVNNHGEVVWVQNAPWPGALGQGPAQVYSSTRGQLTADNTHHEHPVINDLGEVVWSQQEWNNSSHYTQGNSQIYSSVLGQLTFEASMHNSPSLNNHGDVVWVTSNQYINGLINGMYTTVTTSAGMIESVSINDSGEIAYSLDDPGSSSFRIYSTVRGLLTGACEVETPQFQVSLNACGNITYGVWTDFGPSLYTLATNTACTLTGDYDHDGILNNVDNCQFVSNANQLDTNGNGIGDACEPVTTASPVGGVYGVPQSVTLSCSASGASCASTLYCIGTNCTPSSSYGSAIDISVSADLRFTSTDSVGRSEAVKTLAYIIDTVAPVTTAAASGYTFGNWTSSASVPATLSTNDGSGSGVAAGYPQYCVDTTDSCSPAMSYSGAVPVACSSGTVCIQYVRYRSQDNVGNSEAVQSAVIRQDLQLPTTIPSLDGGLYNTGQSVTLACYDNSGSGCANTSYCLGAGCTPAISYSGAIAINSSTMLRYLSSDAAGNSEAVKSRTYTIDSTPPNAPSVTAQSPTQNLKPSWSWTSGGGGNGTYQCQLDNGEWNTTTATFFTPAEALAAGSHTLLVQERDDAGNWSFSGSRIIEIDTTNPAMVLSSLPHGATTSNRVLNIVGIATDANGIKSVSLISNATPTISLSPVGFNQALLLSPGVNTITIAAMDNADNRTRDTRVITLDVTAPVLTVAAPADNSTTKTAALDVIGTINSASTSTLCVKLNNEPQSVLTNNDTYTATVTLAPGINTIEIMATGSTGSTNSMKRTVAYNDQGENLAIIGPIADDLVSTSTYTLSGMVSDVPEGSFVTIDFAGSTYTAPVSFGTFTQELSLSTEKTYTVIAKVKDSNGSTLSTVQRSLIYEVMPITLFSDKASPQTRGIGTSVTFTAAVTNGAGSYEYLFLLKNGNGSYSVVQPYSSSNTWTWLTSSAAAGSYSVMVYARNSGGDLTSESYKVMNYDIIVNVSPPAATLVASAASPQAAGALINFTAGVTNGAGAYQYEFQLKTGNGPYATVKPYSEPTSTWTWNTDGLSGSYTVMAYIRSVGSSAKYELARSLTYNIVSYQPATSVMLLPNVASPRVQGALITFSAAGAGGSGSYDYQFLLRTGSTWSVVQSYSTSTIWTWNTEKVSAGAYAVQAQVRNAGTLLNYEAYTAINYTILAKTPVASVTLAPNVASPHVMVSSVTFTAVGSGGTGTCEYQFYLTGPSTGNVAMMVQNYGVSDKLVWMPMHAGIYTIKVYARNEGSVLAYEAVKSISYTILAKDPAASVTLESSKASPQIKGSSVPFIANGAGGRGPYEYQFMLKAPGSSTYAIARGYSTTNTWNWDTTDLALGTYTVMVYVRNVGSPLAYESYKAISYVVLAQAPANGPITLAPTLPSSLITGTSIIFTATGSGGGGGPYEYQYMLRAPGSSAYAIARGYSTTNTWNWDTKDLALGTYTVLVYVRNVGSPQAYESSKSISYTILAQAPATGVTVAATPSPLVTGASVTVTATGSGGGGGPYEYQFMLKAPGSSTYAIARGYSTTNIWNWDTKNLALGTYTVMIYVRNVGSPLTYELYKAISYVVLAQAPATGVTVVATPSPLVTGASVTVTATGSGGGGGPYEYQFMLKAPGSSTYAIARGYTTTNIWNWDTKDLALGTYTALVYVRNVGSPLAYESSKAISYVVLAQAPATGVVTLQSTVPSPLTTGNSVTFTATGSGGGGGPYEYQFMLKAPGSSTYAIARGYSTTNIWNWDTKSLALGTYTVMVYVRNVGSPLTYESYKAVSYVLK